jgi:hypothetical protein
VRSAGPTIASPDRRSPGSPNWRPRNLQLGSVREGDPLPWPGSHHCRTAHRLPRARFAGGFTRLAHAALREIPGVFTPDAMPGETLDRFCIGK